MQDYEVLTFRVYGSLCIFLQLKRLQGKTFQPEQGPFLRIAFELGHVTPAYQGKTYPVAFRADGKGMRLRFRGSGIGFRAGVSEFRPQL